MLWFVDGFEYVPREQNIRSIVSAHASTLRSQNQSLNVLELKLKLASIPCALISESNWMHKWVFCQLYAGVV